MAWESLTGIATRSHLRLFGANVTLTFIDGTQLQTKAIITPHMTHLREQYSDLESFALIASVAKKDVSDPENLLGITTQDKSYKTERYKIEQDGFFAFFLSE